MAAGGRRRGRIIILLAIILIVCLGVVGFLLRDRLLNPQPSQEVTLFTPTPVQDMQTIIIAAQPIPRGTIITEGVLGTLMYPRNQMVENLFFTDMKSVIGKRSNFDIQQGTPITSGLLTDVVSGSLASVQIPRGMVAISIPMSRLSAVSYALQPGDHVNIIASLLVLDIDPNYQSRLPNLVGSAYESGDNYATCGENCFPNGKALTIDVKPAASQYGRAELDPALQKPVYILPSEPQRSRLVSQTIVQDAIVLGVGEFETTVNQPSQIVPGAPTPEPTPTPVIPEQAPPPQEEKPKPDLVTLIVSPQDAITISYLIDAKIKMNLVLRGAGDDQKPATEAVTLQFIMDQYNIPYPSKLPYALEPRIDTLAEPTPTPVPQQ